MPKRVEIKTHLMEVRLRLTDLDRIEAIRKEWDRLRAECGEKPDTRSLQEVVETMVSIGILDTVKYLKRRGCGIGI